MKKRSERRKHCARAGCSKVRTPPARLPARCKHANKQTGPITIYFAAARSVKIYCNKYLGI